ncbi:hypothetical protein [Cohnella nanjingensis]|uniref:Uncharacterized protein n=1 Tax=Cohnella nanjingensis TaxID=1387779 RepID=A0A7X0RT20_9BACL|nr:hypothetical protein [Cohnella nanjingensis]MBB6673173.1 hypothetical protein [Cohnella nanjingensis]
MNMKKHAKRLKLASIALLIAVSAPLPAMASDGPPPNASYSPTVIGETYQKKMVYFSNDEFNRSADLTEAQKAAILAGLDASRTIPDQLEVLKTIGLEQVTAFAQEGDTLWIGTTKGLQRLNVKEKDPRDYAQYLAGPRYLYNGDDRVTGLYADGQSGVWVRNGNGIVHIVVTTASLKDKADTYERLTRTVNDRNGMIGEDVAYARNGDAYVGRPTTNDNDGLWTSEYAIGEIYRYLTAKREGDAAEMAAAKADATRAAKAVMLLAQISGRGDGFIARSYIMEGDSQPNGLWFKKQKTETVLEDGSVSTAVYGVAVDTSDARKKGELRITDPRLVAEAESAYAAATGHAYADDYGDKGIFPVLADKSGNVVWRLKSPVVEAVDPMLAELYGGNANDDKVIYKADTSSDEVNGQMALLYFAANYLFDGTGAEDAHLKQLAIQFADRIVKGIVTNGFAMLDATGNPTTWARWNATYFAPQIDYTLNTEGVPPGEYEGGYESDVNADEIVSFVKTAIYLTSLEPELYGADNALFREVYDKLWTPRADGGSYDNRDSSYSDATSGIGYIEIMEQYIQRKKDVLSSDFDDYPDINSAIHASENWRLAVNFSDENLFAMAFLPLIDIEMNENPNSERVAKLRGVFDQWWANMKDENNPFYIYLYQKTYPERTDADLGAAAWALARMPQYRVSFPVNNSMRADAPLVQYFNYRDYTKINGDRKGVVSTSRPLPLDETDIHKFNSSPFTAFSGYTNATILNNDYVDYTKVKYNGVSYTSGSMESGTWFLLPYWMGRYHGMLKEQ